MSNGFELFGYLFYFIFMRLSIGFSRRGLFGKLPFKQPPQKKHPPQIKVPFQIKNPFAGSNLDAQSKYAPFLSQGKMIEKGL